MKVTRIKIKDYNQFKDFDINLTYPLGHKKAGQPLEKVCFIGQSATGKTTLLKVINHFNHNQLNNNEAQKLLNKVSLGFSLDKNIKFRLSFENDSLNRPSFILYENDFINYVPSKINIKKLKNFEENSKIRLINFPADLNYNSSQLNDKKEAFNKKIIDFNEISVNEHWNEVLKVIIKHREESLVRLKKLVELAERYSIEFDDGFSQPDVVDAFNKYRNWEKQNPDPIYDLADNCLDQLLKPLKLKIKRKFVFKKTEDIRTIQLEDLNDNEIPFELWSTGTKQLILTALPLYLLKPENTIILFDEPERSLYPDMQRMIIDYYTSLTQDSQLFFATHSPIVASCFEPWEIVELKLDEKGNVYQDKYYKGERHIDNYTIYPQYLNYDLMLSNVFDLKETQNPIRNEKITEVLMLKNYLLKLKNEKKVDTTEFKDRYKEFKRLAVQLAWDFELF